MITIRTKRLTLRPITQADAPVFAALCNDEAIARNTARIPHPYTLADALNFTGYVAQASASGTECPFAVCHGDKIVACSGVSREHEAWELGYWVSAAARGNGVATEAAGAVAHYAFDRLGAEKITAGYFFDNPASGRVLAKLGFRETGEIAKMRSVGRGCDVDTHRVVMRRKDFVRPAGVRINETA